MKAAGPRPARSAPRGLPLLPRPPGSPGRAPAGRQPRPAAGRCRHRQPRAARIRLPDHRRRPTTWKPPPPAPSASASPRRRAAPAARAGRALPAVLGYLLNLPEDVLRPPNIAAFHQCRSPRHRPALPPGTPARFFSGSTIYDREARWPPGQRHVRPAGAHPATPPAPCRPGPTSKWPGMRSRDRRRPAADLL
jgi:hypothetical protein